MSGSDRTIWIRTASGQVRGPYTKAQVTAGWKAGKVPPGCALSANESGPWKSIEACFPAAPAAAEVTARPAPARREAAAPAATTVHAAPAPAAVDGILSVDSTLHGFAGSRAILAAAWKGVRSKYGAVVLRSGVVMAIVGALAALPAVVGIAAWIAALTIGEEKIPGIEMLLGLGLLFNLVSMLVLVPFAMMFASAGCYMLLGVVTGQAFGAWRTLFAWRGKVSVMYPIGLLGTVNEVFGFILQRMLSGPKPGGTARPDFLAKMVGDALESAPWAFLVLAGVAMLDARTTLGMKAALQWAFRSCMANGMLGLLAILVAGLIAAVSTALLVVPGILVGYPLLFLAIGTLYLHAKVRIGEPGRVPPATAASGE